MTGKAWKQITIDFSKRVVKAADEIARGKGKKGRFPFRAFWLKTGSKRDSNGAPLPEKVGKEGSGQVLITPPTLVDLSEKPNEDEIAKLFVGNANLELFNELWTDAQVWARDPVWDGRQEDAAAAAEPSEPAHSEEEEDIPF
jgi:hypothetical protein